MIAGRIPCCHLGAINMQANILVATRTYHDWDAKTLIEFELRDCMYRTPCGSFMLMAAGEKLGDPEVETPYSLQAVYCWLQDLPWQIERTVVASQVA
jgi:hypothetical protein